MAFLKIYLGLICLMTGMGFSNRTLHQRIRPKLHNSGLKIMYPIYISDHWPSASPDLNPLDYKLESVLEGMVCTRHHHNLESLKQALVEAMDNCPMDVIRTDNLTDFGAILWQMAAILNNIFVVCSLLYQY